MVILAALGWAAVESVRYHLPLRPRLALGLADPLISDRLRLGGIGTGAATLLNANSSTTTAMGYDMSPTLVGALMIGAPGLVAAGAAWFAFVPPAACARRVSPGPAADLRPLRARGTHPTRSCRSAAWRGGSPAFS